MTPAAFTDAIARRLTAEYIAYTHAEIDAFVLSAWPLMEADPDVERWAEEFVEVRGAVCVWG